MKTIEEQLERIAAILEQLEAKAEKHADAYVEGKSQQMKELSYYPAAFGFTIGYTNIVAQEIKEILTQLK